MQRVIKKIQVNSRSEIIESSKSITQSMGSKSDLFPLPNPTLEKYNGDIQVAENKCEELEMLEIQLKLKREEVNTAIRQLEDDFSLEATYVESVANGDVETILAAGFTPASNSTTRIVIDQPQNFRCSKSNIKSSLSFTWSSVKGAKSYIIRCTTDINDQNSWNILSVVTKANIKINELSSGSKIWFCVSAIGASGEGPMSEPIAKIIP